jgi:hypothetical protein
MAESRDMKKIASPNELTQELRYMKKIASPNELTQELRSLLAYSKTKNPSREKLAHDLSQLAQRVETTASGAQIGSRGEGEVIESKHWTHKDTGATASLYGAVPWSGAPGDRKENWRLDTVGWTIGWYDGTVGTGGKPFHSKQEAEEWLLQHPRAPRFGY